MLNVLHIRDQLNRGGAEILALDLVNNIKDSDFNLVFFTMGGGDLLQDFLQSNVKIFNISRKHSLDYNTIKSLRNLLKKNKIQIVHSHQIMEGLYAYLASRGLGIKNVLSYHGSYLSKRDKLIANFLINRVDANIAVSKSYLTRLKELEGLDTKKNFMVIYNGIDPKRLLPTEEKSLRKELNIPNNTLLLGMVGNFYNTGRDQFTICKALPRVFSEFPNVHFVFVGGRSEKKPEIFDKCYNYCKNKNILDNTHFIGNRRDINNILNSLDIFVYSSNHDTFGIAVVEAMLVGLPVIVNDIPAFVEITQNGKYAKLFKTKNIKSLINAMRELIVQKKLRDQFGEMGKNWALKNFSIENYIYNLNKLYKNLFHNYNY